MRKPVELLANLPADWTRERVRNRLSGVVGGDWGKEPGDIDGFIDVAVIRVGDMDGIRIRLTDLTVRAVNPSSLRSRQLTGKSLVLEKSGGGEKQNVGRAAIVGDIDGSVICSNFMAALECGDTVVPSFLNYIFSALYSSNLNYPSVRQTTGIQNLDVTAYLSTHVGFPPMPEQRRLAMYLDASCYIVEAAITAKRGQIETLEHLRKATLQRVITEGLGEKQRLTPTNNHWLSKVPVGWNLIMLKRVASIQGGLTLGKIYDGPLVERPYLRVANVQDGHLDLDDITMIEVPAEVAERVTLQVGDVLMTEGGDLDKLGRGYVWNGEIAGCLHQNHVFAVRCVEWKLRPKFLAYVTASQLGRDYFEATGKRTTNLAATNSTKVGQLPVPLPPLDVQDKIIAHLDDVTEKSKALRSELQEQITTLIAYRKSLIHECVTGQRRITETDLARVQSHA
jgi:type I restriction enzyme, S subunit